MTGYKYLSDNLDDSQSEASDNLHDDQTTDVLTEPGSDNKELDLEHMFAMNTSNALLWLHQYGYLNDKSSTYHQKVSLALAHPASRQLQLLISHYHHPQSLVSFNVLTVIYNNISTTYINISAAILAGCQGYPIHWDIPGSLFLDAFPMADRCHSQGPDWYITGLLLSLTLASNLFKDQINLLKLDALNLSCCIGTMLICLDTFNTLLMGLAKHDMSHMQQLLISTAHHHGDSVHTVLNCVGKTIKIVYKLCGYTQDSLEIVNLIYLLGGNQLLVACNSWAPFLLFVHLKLHIQQHQHNY
ncbi:hypothetical protein CONPUDRAFT_77042 [Coniophora puteana RWD-64-598 SS2]|uniref:Uncharacterized protein n=1 Tax=Coniophora puteana (strain RWD-64-598) TaxID=741705 RepID=A0A5M3MA71_CONPW|nr:uncharacterized protein CONPUDRAFT_77042 [Coniophora puteana RWD-64-598 SS2]EIW76023.1 hypothetical protein CONPUDRAFT_77042 [Coniophora puteana RWD-64-598 SS2]